MSETMGSDTSNRTGAARLASQIKQFWYKRGADVHFELDHFNVRDNGIYCVRSDMCNGLPTNSGKVYKPIITDPVRSASAMARLRFVKHPLDIRSAIIRTLDAQLDWLSMREIAGRSKIHITDVYCQLAELRENGYVELRKERGGVKLWRIAKVKRTRL